MFNSPIRPVPAVLGILLLACIGFVGCASPDKVDKDQAGAPQQPLPRELEKSILPEYRIEPPDILFIDALRVVPRPPYHVVPLDTLLISSTNAFATDPISGQYPVDTDGTVNLGDAYGSVKVIGMTLEEARKAIAKQLSAVIKDPRVVVYLGQARGVQQIRGEHLVTPDGVVRLGVYGSVRVAGMTVPEAKAAIEAHLANYLEGPEVAVDVGGYNSKVYYIIFDGGGNGQQILKLPITGNDTVLDALSQSRGLPLISSQNHIWVARPAPANATCDTILPVDWVGITTRGRTATDYQLLPGDRVYVQCQALITFDTTLAKVLNPLTRILGAVLLGDGAYLQLRFPRGTGG
jgi:polysaccharide biosynthesis/export protein